MPLGSVPAEPSHSTGPRKVPWRKIKRVAHPGAYQESPRDGRKRETRAPARGYTLEKRTFGSAEAIVSLTREIHELVDCCLAGDSAAMVQLVDRYRGRVFGLCYRMLGQREDAEDMAQETFVRALRNLHQWDSQRDFEPWLLAIAGNRCRTQLAKRMRRPETVPLVDAEPERPDGLAAARQLAEEVELSLSTLREEYRQAFLLFHEQELSYAEIGEVMDCPLGTVKTWVYRARQELIDRLCRRGAITEGRRSMRTGEPHVAK